MVGVGLTVIVKLLLNPKQLFAPDETVMVEITGAVLKFIPAKEGMFPVPLAAKPIDVLLFVQLNVVPVTPPLKDTADTVAPLHTV